MRFSVIGDSFLDIVAGIQKIPSWGGDSAGNIAQHSGGSAFNNKRHLGKSHSGCRNWKISFFFGGVGSDARGEFLRKRAEALNRVECNTKATKLLVYA